MTSSSPSIHTRFAVATLAASLCALGACNSAPPRTDGMKGGCTRELLLAGNKRFLAGGMNAHAWQEERVIHTGEFGQSPSIGVLSCADSRVPPEIVFDKGVGDLFVVRDAGNFEDAGAAATFEYGVAALGVHSIVVLGHTKCGAIDAAVSGKAPSGTMSTITDAIRPALVDFMKSTAQAGTTPDLCAASEANVRWQMKRLLERSALLRTASEDGSLTLLGAMYDVDTGVIRFLD